MRATRERLAGLLVRVTQWAHVRAVLWLATERAKLPLWRTDPEAHRRFLDECREVYEKTKQRAGDSL
jgi:hypothetical protein